MNVLHAVCVGLAGLLTVSAAEARVTRIEVQSREAFAGGAEFGQDGPYERVVGRFYGELDPARTAAALEGRYRVHLVTVRGFGETAPGGNAEGLVGAPTSAEIRRYIEEQGLRRPALIGHSMGGKVAITLARQAPQRCLSLMVADIAPVAYQHGHDDVFAALEQVRKGKPTNRREAEIGRAHV